MSLEPQGNLVYENIKFMNIKNVFLGFSTRYLSKISNFWPKNTGFGYAKNDVIPLLIIISPSRWACVIRIPYVYMVWCYEIMIFKEMSPTRSLGCCKL